MKGTILLSVAVIGSAAGQMLFPGMSGSSSSSQGGSQGLEMATPAVPPPATGNPALSNVFRGAVPRGEATGAPLELSLDEAIQLGLERNLGTVLSSVGERNARAERTTALARLLPQIHAQVDETSRQMNLAAFGFPPSPAIPSIVGPFKVFDARAYISQSLFDLRKLYAKRASESEVEAAVLDSNDARDTIVEVVTALYWNALAAASRIEASQAQIASAETSYEVAEDRRAAGLVPSIDVLRAQVQLQNERQRLIASQSSFEKQKLTLSEAIGIPGGQELELTDALMFQPLENLPTETVVEQAFLARSDYQSQLARVEAAKMQRKGAGRFRVPTLTVDGDYGTLGRSPVTNNHSTYNVMISLNIPIFAGGANEAAVARADAEVERQESLLAELRSHIGFEIRSAMLDLDAAAQQVEVSQSAVELANQQTVQAQDRFEAGVTDTLEVVQAQQGLALANESYIDSVYAYNLAKVRLARALGGTEENLKNWMTGGGLQ